MCIWYAMMEEHKDHGGNVERDLTKPTGSITVERLTSANRDIEVQRSAVWEEALIQEFLYAIGHLNHCEQHLIEVDSSVGVTLFGDIIDRIREQRKVVGEVLFLIERLEAMKKSGEIRTSWESIWCTLKHLTSALIHVDECIEKLLKRVKDIGGSELPDYINMLLRVRYSIMESLMNLISRAKVSGEFITKAATRCREDLCIEVSTKS